TFAGSRNSMSNDVVLILPPDSNQARGLAQYALDFLADKFDEPSDAAYRAVERFHLDSVACGVSALALGANAPVVLRREAMEYQCPQGVPVFGSRTPLMAEKAVAANSSAVREWDSNGTNFGYDPAPGPPPGAF